MINPQVHSWKRDFPAVVGAAGDVVRIEDAMSALGLVRGKAQARLAEWARRGWLRRVGPGAYVQAPVSMVNEEKCVLENPWALVPALFGPAYVGGRTAAAHWGLTDQIFRDTIVFTARRIQRKEIKKQGAVFVLRPVREDMMFGLKPVWRGRTKVTVSDVHRTVVDMLNEPKCGGGIQHTADCLGEYLESGAGDPDRLISCADKLGNGAVFKRLGFFAESYSGPAGEALAEACRARLTKGRASLDPGFKGRRRLVTKWALWAPEAWKDKAL